MKEKEPHYWSLIANTSHSLLDDVCFVHFIQKHVNCVEFIRLLSRGPDQNKIYQAFFDAEESVFTPKLIERAFQNTGLFPFNQDVDVIMGKINAANLSEKIQMPLGLLQKKKPLK